MAFGNCACPLCTAMIHSTNPPGENHGDKHCDCISGFWALGGRLIVTGYYYYLTETVSEFWKFLQIMEQGER